MEIDLLKAENERLKAEIQYLEDSLVAIVTGELPEKFDLNQLLLATRARDFMRMLKNCNKNCKGEA